MTNETSSVSVNEGNFKGFGEPLKFSGNECLDRKEFLTKAVNAVQLLEKRDFYQWLSNNGKQFQGGVTGYFFVRRDPQDKNIITDFDCAINTTMFVDVYGVDYSDLIPVVKLHELLEGWEVASKYAYPKTDIESAHFEARVAELEYVEELGLTEKYLSWFDAIGAPQHYIDELKVAIETVKSRKTNKV